APVRAPRRSPSSDRLLPERHGDRPRCAPPRWIDAGEDAAQDEHPERRPRGTRLEEKEVDALGKSREAREDRIEPARRDQTEPESERCRHEHERRRLEED